VPDTDSTVVLNPVARTRSNNESIYLQTSTYASGPTTSISVSTLATSYINGSRMILEKDRGLNEKDHVKNEEDHMINYDDQMTNEEEDHMINKQKDMLNDNADTNDGLEIKEERRIINEEETNITKKDRMLSKKVRKFNEKEKMINDRYFGENRKHKIIGCKEVFKREMSGANRVRKIVTQDLPSWTIYKYNENTRNCSSFIDERGYITHHLTTEEQQFPIAFSILMYKNVEQVERLLRAIYRPQNIYCIHVDSKTNIEIYKALSGISQCFENVFVLRKRVNVIWGKMSVLTPELLCIEELWKRHKTWKYFINLTGQEFPLKTNYELVKILQAYNGANDVEATVKL
jgi:hypothetical protein